MLKLCTLYARNRSTPGIGGGMMNVKVGLQNGIIFIRTHAEAGEDKRVRSRFLPA